MDTPSRSAAARAPRRDDAPGGARRVALIALVVAGSTLTSLGVGAGFRALGLGEANIVLVFLLGVAFAAYAGGRNAAAPAAVAAVLTFNFFFTHPLHTFAVSELQYVFTFLVLLVTGVAVSEMVARLRERAVDARDEAEANRVLYDVGRVLASSTSARRIAQDASREIEARLGKPVAVFLAARGPRPLELADAAGAPELTEDAAERSAALRAMGAGRPSAPADRGDGTQGTYLPLVPADMSVLGALGVLVGRGRPARRESLLLGALALQIALALERDALAEAAQARAVEAESERLRANLLATVSHDLRTPLATIAGGASALLELERGREDPARAELLREILAESHRLTRMVENLLQLGRVDDGRLVLHEELYPLDELLGAAVARLERYTDTRRIEIEAPADLPLVPVDADLIVNVLVNLLDNALRYAPQGPIYVTASRAAERLRVSVRDRGPGLGPGSERLFEPFVRAQGQSERGSGLGLAICKAVVTVHGGTIGALDRPDGGAEVWLELPLATQEVSA